MTNVSKPRLGPEGLSSEVNAEEKERLTMDPLAKAAGMQKERQTIRTQAVPVALTALSVRLFTYGGQQGKLRDLVWQPESALTGLLRTLVHDGQGNVTQIGDNVLLAHFENPLHALATARSLQQKLLTFHQEGATEQIVAAALIHDWNSSPKSGADDAATEVFAPPTVMADPGPAQILVTEKVHDAARSVPGFEFNAMPVRGPGETGTAETFYELLWADASTYAHLRQAIHDASASIPRQNRYAIEAELGRGAMGLVYKAHDRLIGRTVALKTIAVDKNARDHDSLVERLKQEAKAAGGLDHPNIITIYDVGQEDDLVYLSMQFVEGVPLSTVLAEGKLPPMATLLAYADQICSAVGFAHKKGVIHRDLKPANLMITADGIVKVLDFGIAKLGDTGLTQAGMVIGTPTYMAPEQAIGKKIDHRSDIYALGAVFYELFTRERPFKGEITTIFYKLINEDPVPPSVINPSLPMGIDAIIRKALAKDPQQRFQTCEAMRAAFAEQAALISGAVATPVATSRPLITSKALQPQGPEVAPLVPETTIAKRRTRRWLYVGLVTCILAAAAVLALRIARVRAAMWAFQHPGEVSRPSATVKPTQLPPTPSSITPDIAAKEPANALAGTQSTSQSAPAETSVAGTNPATPANAQLSGSQPISLPATNNASKTTASDPTTKAAEIANDESTKAKVEPAGSGAKPNRLPVANEVDPGRTVASVEGFKRSDVPDLIRRADAAASRGDYAGARYGYSIVLRLERQNTAARAGLRRVNEALKNR